MKNFQELCLNLLDWREQISRYFLKVRECYDEYVRNLEEIMKLKTYINKDEDLNEFFYENIESLNIKRISQHYLGSFFRKAQSRFRIKVECIDIYRNLLKLEEPQIGKRKADSSLSNQSSPQKRTKHSSIDIFESFSQISAALNFNEYENLLNKNHLFYPNQSSFNSTSQDVSSYKPENNNNTYIISAFNLEDNYQKSIIPLNPEDQENHRQLIDKNAFARQQEFFRRVMDDDSDNNCDDWSQNSLKKYISSPRDRSAPIFEETYFQIHQNLC
ncbi:UNKNOWN [Stylonychia lemnae]|uniref:Uncharacterized protein n=1 Tax=Stylonychia lemnae TaxID=5949 RepID=A0A078AGF4_STYLE|nr:UNKNOWN [Stylonychia lemnae]|eukprot:CDW80891.1 UNKNOWN [Stylonychia lemnae]